MAISQSHQSTWRYDADHTNLLESRDHAHFGGILLFELWRTATQARVYYTHTQTNIHIHIRSAHARIKVLQGNKHKIAYTTCCSSIKQLNFGTRCVLRVSLSCASNCKNLFRNSTIKNVDWPGCPLGKRSYHFAFISVFVNILLVFCLMLLACSCSFHFYVCNAGYGGALSQARPGAR